jgi:hypothetical protein
MQKVSGKTMVMLYKSCRVFHKESNKIEIAFFCFFKKFLRIFQESARHQVLLKIPFATGSLELFYSSQI